MGRGELRIVKRQNVLNFLFYFGFFIISISKMFERSALIEIPTSVLGTIDIVAMMSFLVKFLLDKHSLFELVICTIFFVLMLTMRLFTGFPVVLLVSFCAFIAMKNVNIRTVLKLDIAIKSIFLMMHALAFAIDLATGYEAVYAYIDEVAKGVTASLYFVNPNSTGLIGTWIAIEILFLSDKNKKTSYIIPTLIALFVFFITASRTPLLVYAVYVVLCLIKNEKVLTILQRVAYPLFCVVSFLMIEILVPGSQVYDMINSATSGRVAISRMAYDRFGMTFLPTGNTFGYPIDVFYVKCFVNYGLVTLAIAYIPHLLLLNGDIESKRISIVISLYLLFEVALVNVGFAPAYLILADALFNKKAENHGNKD